MTRLSTPFYLLLLLIIAGAGGQNDGRRGDTSLDFDYDHRRTATVESECNCNSSVVAAVIITAAVFLVLAGMYWCYLERQRRRYDRKPDPEAACDAAYDNPQFQGDDLDQPSGGGQTHINVGQQPLPANTQRPTATTTIATNTTSTLERGKTTLERVMAAVIRGSRSDSKRTKDDSFIGPKDVIVPLEGHDFTGLGFTVHGNLKEGLYVKEVMSRGPASQSGQVLPGDRIVALTVLTDHVVFKDALTILSYASPYPVLLHLKKNQSPGTYSASSTLSSKGKAIQSSSSFKLVHPAYRSQSSGDLTKIGDIDIKRIKMGVLKPPSKGKSSGVAIDISKAQANRPVQRKAESRHSERAIDVPGVEVRSKSVAVDIEGQNGDKFELAKVQVHRPMSPNIGLDVPDASVEIQTFEDSSLSGAAEILKDGQQQIDFETPKVNKPNPKTKFGVKVFPDIVGFKKNVSKTANVDLEVGRNISSDNTKIDQKTCHESDIEVQHNVENSKIELSIDVNDPKLKSIDLKAPTVVGKSSSEISRDSDGEIRPDLKLDISDFKIPSLSERSDEQNPKTSGEANDKGFLSFEGPDITVPSVSIKSQERGEKDASSPPPEEKDTSESKREWKIELPVPDFNLPSLSFVGKDKTDKHLEAGDGIKSDGSNYDLKLKERDVGISLVNTKDDIKIREITNKKPSAEENVERSGQHFKVDLPDLNLPSMSIKANTKTDTMKGENEQNEKADIDMTKGQDIKLPSAELSAGIRTDQSHDPESQDDKKKSKHSFKIGMPDISLPSFGLKSSSKHERKSGDEEAKRKEILEHETENDNPDINLSMPSASIEAEVKSSKTEDKETKDDKDKKKSKHSFKIGMPDISIPSFSMKGSNKSDKESDHETEITKSKHSDDLKLGTNVRVETDKSDKKKSKHGFKITMPDINMPSFSMKSNAKIEKDSDETDKNKKSEQEENLEDLNVNIPLVSAEASVKTDSDGDEKVKRKSKHGFKIEMPDISMPSFGLKGSSKVEKTETDANDLSTKDSKTHEFNLQGPDVKIPSVTAEVEIKGQQSEDDSSNETDKKKSKHSFKMPDISMPSLSLKGKAKSEKENEHAEKHEHTLNVDAPAVDIPSVSIGAGVSIDPEVEKDTQDKDKKKSKHGFKIGMPDINLPTFGLKSNTSDIEHSDAEISESKHELNLETQNVNIPSMHLSTGLQADADDSGSEEEKEKFRSGNGFKIGMPDINAPSFSLKENANKFDDYDVGFQISEGTNKDIELIGPDAKKQPDVNVPSFPTGLRSGKPLDNYITENDSKYAVQLAGAKIATPSVNLEGSKVDYEIDSNISNERNPAMSNFNYEFDTAGVNIPPIGKHDVQYISEIEEEQNDVTSGLGIDMPDITMLSLKLEKEKSLAKDLQNKTEMYSDPAHSIDNQNINLNANIDAPDVLLSGERTVCDNKVGVAYDVISDSDSIKMQKIETNQSNETPGINFELKKSEFSIPTFENRNYIYKDEKNSDDSNYEIGSHPDNRGTEHFTSMFPESEFGIKLPSNLSSINAKLDSEGILTSSESEMLDLPYELKFEAPELSASDNKLHGNRTDTDLSWVSSTDINVSLPQFSATEKNMKLSPKHLDNDDNTPDFRIPNLKLLSNDPPETDNGIINFKIPNLEASDNRPRINRNQDISDAGVINSELGHTFDLQEYMINDGKLDMMTSVEHSLPDELKVEANSRTNPSVAGDIRLPSHLEAYNFDVNAPTICSPNLSIMTSADGLDLSDNVRADSPDADVEFQEDEMAGGLNVTDATKNKRFGLRINATDTSLPLVQTKSTALDPDKNQSDEMKSFNLKLKSPNSESSSVGAGLSEGIQPELYVHLPRVKIADSKRSSSDENEHTPTSVNLTHTEDKTLSSPSITLPMFSLNQTVKQNESDEWKTNDVDSSGRPSKVTLLREKFNTKMKGVENPPGSKTKSDFHIAPRNLDFNMDEPDFIIPDLNIKPGFSSPLGQENFNVENLKLHESHAVNLGLRKNPNMNWKGAQSSNLSESDIHLREKDPGMKINIPDLNIPTSSDVNISLDSSSVDTESDLPEADSDFKRASRDFSIDVSVPKLSMTKLNLEKSFHKDTEFEHGKTGFQRENLDESGGSNFGSVFGFRGFKKHIKIEGAGNSEIDNNNDNFALTGKSSAEINSTGKADVKISSNTSMIKDLPEVDYDLDFKDKSFPESDINVNFKPNEAISAEGNQDVNYSIHQKLQQLEKSYNMKQADENQTNYKTERNYLDINKKLDIKFETEGSLNAKNEEKYTEVDDPRNKDKNDDNDDDKTRSKMKTGLGYGFKSFSKSSDSDDTEVENKFSVDPDGHIAESKDTARVKPKKTFSFKGFGKSSSDTEEEHSERVSANPMQNVLSEEKIKVTNKSNIGFGFKGKGSKNSDSEDNADNEKVHVTPQVEGNLKKTKVKGNLGFGFMSKAKSSEADVHAEVTSENKKEKYDTRSEPEGGEEEKLSMDSRGSEEQKSKSRYGIGFGFRRSHSKASSDSEGAEPDEQKVHLDERGMTEKSKEPKGKSLKLGFKGLRNLKGKIQTEINKIRHDSPSTDDEGIAQDEAQNMGEKRKKLPKKKDKDKKLKREPEKYLDPSEEAAIASAGLAAKDNRRKRFANKSSSSSSDSNSEDEEKPMEMRKKKKSKVKRKEEGKIITTNIMNVSVPSPGVDKNGDIEINEVVSASHRSFEMIPSISDQTSHVTVVMSEPKNTTESVTFQNVSKQSMEVQPDPRNYVVVREMKLKEQPLQMSSDEINETIEKTIYDRNVLSPVFFKGEAMLSNDNETEAGFWRSDSDMDNRQSTSGEINVSKDSVTLSASGKQRVLTDSEELKRKATSLGDLSRLHEGSGLGTLLERAVSLDLKNAAVGPPNLHVRRLQLPDSSATSIDEVDEQIALASPKRVEIGGGLKAASQWGTLEEAMTLGGSDLNTNKHMKIDSTVSAPSIVTRTTFIKTSSDEGAPISNIEISGERGPSITAVSVKKDEWDDSFEDEERPSLPSSPIPVEKTTITVVEDESIRKTQSEHSGSDPSILVVGTESVQAINNFHHLNYQLNPSTLSNDSYNLPSHGLHSSSSTSINSDSGRYSPRMPVSGEKDDAGGVTITMVPAESHPVVQTMTSVHQDLPLMVPQSKSSRPLSSPPELTMYENIQQPSLVTVSHGWMQENGDIVLDTDHNISDEFLTPDSTPQKSMTQITLDGDGVSGITVTEGTISRTVIINPDKQSEVNIVQTDNSEIEIP